MPRRMNPWKPIAPSRAARTILQTLRTPLLAGRDFTDAGRCQLRSPCTMVNQALVERYWPGQNAIGKHISCAGHKYTVVGVAANGKYRRLVYDAAPLVLLPLMQRYDSDQILHVRTAGDPLALCRRRRTRRSTASIPTCPSTT